MIRVPVLDLLPRGAFLPPGPAEADPTHQIWRDLGGRSYAESYFRDGSSWFHFAGVAGYRHETASERVKAFPQSPVSEETIRETYLRSVLPVVLQEMGDEVLHSSAVETPAGVAAFCAPAMTGKSTLAFALSCHGFPAWADDAVAVSPSGAGFQAIPLPFRLRLRSDAAGHFDRTTPELPALTRRSTPLPLAGIYLLRRRPIDSRAPTVEVRGMPPARAFPALLEHAYCFTLADRDRNRSMIARYMEIAERVPVQEILFQPGFDRLEEVVAAAARAITAR